MCESSIETPILFIIFNKIEETKRVFKKIREQKPKFLYIAADGPRKGLVGETEKCHNIREWLINHIDWNCELKTLYRNENIGCGKGISESITWFFSHVSEGIILEDDCLPCDSFFKFCTELLEKYRYDNRVSIISGNNFQMNQPMEIESDYYFSIFPSTWGSAFWRRTWEGYDIEINNWPINKVKILDFIFKEKKYKQWWSNIFDKIYLEKPKDTFAFQFHYLTMNRRQLAVIPKVNLVSNIGHGSFATHTTDEKSRFSNMPTFELGFPLLHPKNIARNYKADLFSQKILFGEVESAGPLRKIKHWLKKQIIKPLNKFY